MGKCKAEAVAAITGVGWTPGVTNMLARLGADGFDEVESINVAWGCHTSDTEGKAVTFHTIHIFRRVRPILSRGPDDLDRRGLAA